MGTGAQLAMAAAAYATVAALAWRVPKLLRSASPTVVVLAAAAGAVGGWVATGAPTGADGYDALLRSATGVAFVAAGCAASARPRLVASTVLALAALAGGGGAWPAAVAWGASLALVLLATDGAAIGALVGLALGQAALRLDWPDATGATLVLGAGAFVIVAASALAHVHRRTRRRAAGVAVVIGVVLVCVGGVWAVTTWSVRDDLNRAVDTAREGLDAARAGNSRMAARRFDRAARLFAGAERRLDAWWVRPVAAIPGAAQNADALRVMTSSGRELAAAGATAARRADPDDITPIDGVVPLDDVRALEEPLTDASRALTRARTDLAGIDSPWIVGTVADKADTLDQKLARAVHDLETARLAVSVVPDLLGGDGERRYLVVFQNPAEQRANGGVIGNLAELAYRDGAIELLRNERDSDFNLRNPGTARTLVGPDDYVRRYAQYEPESTIQNVTLSPDFPSVAEVLEGVYPQTGAGPIDGVISLDPLALAEFLRLTGEVTVPGYDVTLHPDDAAELLLREQYVRFPDPVVRAEFLRATVAAVFDRLRSTQLPGPAYIGEVLGPMVHEGRLQIHSRDRAEQRFFRRIGATGGFPAVRGGDFLGVATQNSAGNKIDVFQQRTVRYAARVDPATGTVDASLSIRLRNDAPASGLPDYVIGSFPDNPLPRGTSQVMVSVYSPLALRAATVDGEPVALLEDEELGRRVYTAQVTVPPGGRRDLDLTLQGAVDLGSSGRYRLRVWQQATVVPDRTRVSVGAAPGWTVTPVRGLRATPDGAARTLTGPGVVGVVAGFEEG